jgi:hypothetical protein
MHCESARRVGDGERVENSSRCARRRDKRKAPSK